METDRVALQTRPLRVLLADDRLGYERSGLHGGGSMMLTWTRGLREQGIDVTTVILRDPGALREAVGDLPFIFLRRHEFDPRTLFDFVSLVRLHDVDLLHVQGHGASTFGRLAAMITRRPVVVHVHGDYRLSVKGYPPYVKVIDHTLAPMTSRVIAVSEAIRKFAIEVQGFRPQQVEVLHNPVDRRRFRQPTSAQRKQVREGLGISPDARVVVTVGRLDRLKGVDLQVAAWARIAAARPDATLLIVGDGPERDNLERAVACLPEVGTVRLLGRRDDVERLLWSADLSVLSSRSEGLPLVLVEAMSTGLPVVATRVGGIPEIVTHGSNGLLVPPNDPDRLADSILDLLADDARRVEMGLRALEAANRFDLVTTVHRLEQIYRVVLRRSPSDAAPA